MIENDENIREGDLRVVFQPVKGTFCVAQQFSWQPLSEFTSLGLNLIVSVYRPDYDDEE